MFEVGGDLGGAGAVLESVADLADDVSGLHIGVAQEVDVGGGQRVALFSEGLHGARGGEGGSELVGIGSRVGGAGDDSRIVWGGADTGDGESGAVEVECVPDLEVVGPGVGLFECDLIVRRGQGPGLQVDAVDRAAVLVDANGGVVCGRDVGELGAFDGQTLVPQRGELIMGQLGRELEVPVLDVAGVLCVLGSSQGGAVAGSHTCGHDDAEEDQQGRGEVARPLGAQIAQELHVEHFHGASLHQVRLEASAGSFRTSTSEIRPSRTVMVRCAISASTWLCVTMTMVVPRSRLIRSRRESISLLVS